MIKNNGIYSKYYKLQQSVEEVIKNHEKLEENKLKVEEIDHDKKDENDRLICSDDVIEDNILQNEKQMGAFEVLTHLIKYNKPIYYAVIAIIGAIILGAIEPLIQPWNIKLVYQLMKLDCNVKLMVTSLKR